MSVALRLYRWNGEQIHVLYERGVITDAWLCGTEFEDVKMRLHTPHNIIVAAADTDFPLLHIVITQEG